MTLTLDQLFASPDHYFQAFDGDAAVFVPMDRAAYARSIFLDARISPAAESAARVPVAALAAAAPMPIMPQPKGRCCRSAVRWQSSSRRKSASTPSLPG